MIGLSVVFLRVQRRYLRSVIVLCLFLVSPFPGHWDRSADGGTHTGDAPGRHRTGLIRVGQVYDGDTVGIIDRGRPEKLRLIGIDAPEMAQRPWGKRAKQHLEDILDASSWTVSFESDVVDRDKYGRRLGYLRTPDGRLINEMMLRDGYAVLFTFPPNVKYAGLFTAAQREARERRVGVWGRNGLRQEPAEYRRQHPRR